MSMKMKVLVINGPNLNMLGIREPDIYGKNTYADLVALIGGYCEKNGIEYECFQSNYEGAIVEKIQSALGVFDGIVINPAAYTHTSVAILDALKCVAIPAVEVHISDIDTREEFRRHSFISSYCIRTIKGMGFDGYIEAVKTLSEQIKR